MSVRSCLLLICTLCACAHEETVAAQAQVPAQVPVSAAEPAASVPAPSIAEASAPEASAAGTGTGSGTGSGAGAPVQAEVVALYERCKDRVEGMETERECSGDADCAVAGCSSEVCVAKTVAPEVMTTCEIRSCFQVLQACTCQDGMCRWVLGAPKKPIPGVPDPDVQ